MKLSVIIPAYNEAKVIANTISEVKVYLDKKNIEHEIIVVDDKSTDKTLRVLQDINGIKILKNLKNHGKGYTVAKGVKESRGEWILFTDADNSTSIDHLDNFMKYTDDYKLIIASRALPDSNISIRQSAIKVALGKLGNLLIQGLIAPGIKDTQCGFKLFHKDLKPLWEKLTIEGFAFDFEIIYLARKNSFKIKELPVTWVNNFDSTVKWHTYITSLLSVFKVKINDLKGKY